MHIIYTLMIEPTWTWTSDLPHSSSPLQAVEQHHNETWCPQADPKYILPSMCQYYLAAYGPAAGFQEEPKDS